MTQFNPSPFQLAIGDAVDEPSAGNLLINAVAGSGKTTTLVWLLERIPQRLPGAFLGQSITFLAFNKAIADALRARCPRHVACSTFHSLGLRALQGPLGRPKVDGRKCRTILYPMCDRNDPDFEAVLRVVSLLKSTGYGTITETSPTDLIDEHSILCGDPAKVVSLAQRVLDKSNALTSIIDFDDMLYLAVLLNAPLEKQDWVFVDEAQDTNEIQVEILARLQKPCKVHIVGTNFQSATRLVFVGDPYQSIYGFRGATSSAMARIGARFSCTELPLSVSYRCPQAVVAEAVRWLTKF